MGRHAKAMSAGSTFRPSNRSSLFGGAFAILGGRCDDKGSGASKYLPLTLVAFLGLLLLAIAPVAQAAKGSLDAFGSTGQLGGQFSWTLVKSGVSGQAFARGTISGVAVNSNGTGTGASAGDVYAVDRGSHRIQQLSKSGEFIRAWGYDVVASGPDNTGANEQQTVTIPGSVTGGTFTLTATTAVSEGMTKILASFEGGQPRRPNQKIVNLSYSFGPFHVGDTFTNADDSNLKPTPVTVAEPEGVTVANFTSTEPPISTTENVSAPAYRSRFEGRETTAPIAFNATAAQVQAALEALPGIGSGGVTVTGGPGGTAPFTVTFVGEGLAHNDVPQMTASSTSLVGGAATVATAVPGGGIEVCKAASSPADVCKGGTPIGVAGGMSSPQGIAIEQATGNVYVTDPGNRRIDVFSANGAFEGAFGWGVATGASSFQFCAATCQTGLSGAGAGEFATATEPAAAIGAPAFAPVGSPNAGNLLVPNTGNNRVDEFQPTVTSGVVTGMTFVRGFGWDTITGAPTTLEACTTGSTCKAGTSGGGAGQFSTGALSSVAEDTTGAIYAVNGPSSGNCSATARCVVQKFNNAATSASDLGAAQLTLTSGLALRNAATAVAVDPTNNDVYVAKSFELTQSEDRIFRYDSSGVLQETMFKSALLGWRGPNFGYELSSLLNSAERATRIMGFGFDAATRHLVFGTTEEEQERIYTVGDITAEATESLSATLGEPAATDVTGEEATLHGVVSPALGVGQTRYVFEYTNGTAWVSTPRQSAGNGSEVGSPGSCAVENPASCEVEVPLSGLEPGQTYQVRLHAFIPADPELSATSAIGKFKMTGVPPTAETSAAWWSSPASTKPDLTMRGFVNPKDEVTSYYFQLVNDEQFQESGFSEAEDIPLAPGDPAAKSFNTIEVQQTAYELDATKSYDFRVVAINPSGTTYGATRTIEPPKPGERFYELVSSGESGGTGVGGVQQIADQEERVIFSGTPFEGQLSSPSTYGPKFADRTAAGWHFVPVALDPRYAYVGLGTLVQINSFYTSAAQANRLLFGSGGNRREAENGLSQGYFAGNDGGFVPASPLLTPIASEPGATAAGARILGGSADLSQLIITNPGGRTYLPGEPLIPGSDLYLLNSETFEMSLLNVDSSGNQIGGACGAEIGGPGRKVGSVSLDGSVYYFSARPGLPVNGPCSEAVKAEFTTRIFKREGNTTTEISKSECSRPVSPEPCKEIVSNDAFRGASGDGSIVLFTSSRQLTNSDVDSAEDLYLYDSSPPGESGEQPKLLQVTAGEATAGHPTVGSGAEFQGIASISSDGSRVYFVAKGQLTTEATAGQNNLYVYERDAAHPAGRLHFIAVLGSEDRPVYLDAGQSDPITFLNTIKETSSFPGVSENAEGQETYGDGRFLIFTSLAKLVPEDTDSARDIYHYDDLSGQLLCISCVGNGEKPAILGRQPEVSNLISSVAQQTRFATPDGSKIVFMTQEGLVPEDQNNAMDVYLWDEGELSLISAATGKQGTADFETNTTNFLQFNLPPQISLDGENIFFATTARLSPEDTDRALDLYDARVEGGFSLPKPEARVCIDGEVCRGATTEPPKTANSESSSFNGGGNPPIKAKSRSCPKGKALRKGHCVKQHKHGRKKHHRSGMPGKRGSK